MYWPLLLVPLRSRLEVSIATRWMSVSLSCPATPASCCMSPGRRFVRTLSCSADSNDSMRGIAFNEKTRCRTATTRVRVPLAADIGVVFVIGTDGVGAVELAHHEPVPGEGRDLHPEVAWQRNHHRLACPGTDGQDHDGIGQIGPLVARSTVAEQKDVDAFVVLDLPAEGTGLVTLRLDQRDEVLRLGVWRDGMNRRPGTKDGESRNQ